MTLLIRITMHLKYGRLFSLMLAFLVLGLAVVPLSGSFASGQVILAQNQIVSENGQTYTHPQNKFTIFLPAGAEILATEGAVDLAVRSRKGWTINIQSSPANPSLTLEQMAGHFEARYLGPDKPWTQKLSGSSITENSYTGIYDGSGSRLQLIIKKTRLWDFVLMFVAPGESFNNSVKVFQQVVSTFQPLEPVNGFATGQDGDDGSGAIVNLSVADKSSGYRRFEDQNLGYAISYPSHWVVSRPDEYTSVFSGPAESNARYVAISIRNVSVLGTASTKGVADGMLQQLKAQMAYTVSDIRHDPTVGISIGQGAQMIQGLQMISSFRQGDIAYRQWSIAAPRHEGNVVHVWTYIAPMDRFHIYQEFAEKMAGSLSIIPATGP